MKGGRVVDEKFTIIPNVHIRFDDKLESDKLLLYLMLMQNRTTKDICIFSIRQLCNRLNTTTRNSNRTKYIIDTLKYFEDKEILCFSDSYNCKNEIKIEEYTNENKIDILYAELINEIDGDFTIIYDNEVDMILELCQQKNINKYNIIHLYLYILSFIKANNSRNVRLKTEKDEQNNGTKRSSKHKSKSTINRPRFGYFGNVGRLS